MIAGMTEKEYKRKYYLEHREKMLQIAKDYYQANKIEIRAKAKLNKDKRKKWEKENKTKMKAYHRNWYQANRERVLLLNKKWYERNPEKLQIYRKKKYNNSKTKMIFKNKINEVKIIGTPKPNVVGGLIKDTLKRIGA